jgi:hypothetical protein
MTRQRSTVVATTSAAGGSPVSAEISPKNSPRRSRCRSLAVDLDPGLALEDDVEVPAAEPPPKHALTRGEDVLVVRVGDRLQLRGREVGEQRELPQAFGDVHG